MRRYLLSGLATLAFVAASWSSKAHAQDPESPPLQPDPQPQEQQPVVVVSAPAATTADRPAAIEPKGEPNYKLIRLNAGMRVGYIPDRGFDAYSANNVLPQFSIDGTYPLLTSGKLVLGAGLGWDGGGRSDKVRGLDSDLVVHRLYVPIEARFHIVPSVYAFGKVSPGAAAMIASVSEGGGSSNRLSSTGWAFSADASAGASILLTPRSHYERREVRVWLTPEVGYGFTTRASLNVNPGRDDKDLLGSDENTSLRGIALNGFFWRASVGMTF